MGVCARPLGYYRLLSVIIVITVPIIYYFLANTWKKPFQRKTVSRTLGVVVQSAEGPLEPRASLTRQNMKRVPKATGDFLPRSAASAPAHDHLLPAPAVHGGPGEGRVRVHGLSRRVLPREAVPSAEHLVPEPGVGQVRSGVASQAQGGQPRVGAGHTHVCRVLLLLLLLLLLPLVVVAGCFKAGV